MTQHYAKMGLAVRARRTREHVKRPMKGRYAARIRYNRVSLMAENSLAFYSGRATDFVLKDRDPLKLVFSDWMSRLIQEDRLP